MTLITLTTDFGLKDYYVGAVKGRLYSLVPDVTIVDISHSISAYSVIEASYIIERAYKNFPKGTIHIIGVDTELTLTNKYMVVVLGGHFFIGTDNGVFSKISNGVAPTQIFRIERDKTTFPTLKVFTEVACHIAEGKDLNKIGISLDSLNSFTPLNLDQTENGISGKVVYVDNCGNIITNITKSIFDEVCKGREFDIIYKGHKFTKVHETYNGIVGADENSKESEGKRVALFNSENMLEIAIYKGEKHNGASFLLGVSPGESLAIYFK